MGGVKAQLVAAGRPAQPVLMVGDGDYDNLDAAPPGQGARPFLRKGAAACPLMLIVVRGKDYQRTRRQPLPFNARQD